MMRFRCGLPVSFGLLGCLVISGCGKSNTAEMPTKVVPRPAEGLKTGQPAPPGSTTPTSGSAGESIAPDPGSP